MSNAQGDAKETAGPFQIRKEINKSRRKGGVRREGAQRLSGVPRLQDSSGKIGAGH
jgi:hypothetical protein